MTPDSYQQPKHSMIMEYIVCFLIFIPIVILSAQLGKLIEQKHTAERICAQSTTTKPKLFSIFHLHDTAEDATNLKRDRISTLDIDSFEFEIACSSSDQRMLKKVKLE